MTKESTFTRRGAWDFVDAYEAYDGDDLDAFLEEWDEILRGDAIAEHELNQAVMQDNDTRNAMILMVVLCTALLLIAVFMS